MASFKSMVQLGAKSGTCLSRLGVIYAGSTIKRPWALANSYRWLCSNASGNRLDYGQNSPNGMLVYGVNNSDLVKRLEEKGIPTKDAKAATSALAEASDDHLKTISQNLNWDAERQKILMAAKEKSSNFNSKIQSSQHYRLSVLRVEVEKLQDDIRRMHNELRFAIPSSKTTSLLGQRIFPRNKERATFLRLLFWMIPVYICWKPILDDKR